MKLVLSVDNQRVGFIRVDRERTGETGYMKEAVEQLKLKYKKRWGTRLDKALFYLEVPSRMNTRK